MVVYVTCSSLPPCRDLSFLRAVEFPNWVTQLFKLQYLNLESDYPLRQGRLLNDDISHLTALTSMSLEGNNLDGYLPKSWANLVNLQELSLRSNQFQGTIPTSFLGLTSLISIDLSRNQLSGRIPAFATNIKS
ncbi:unnamed protein product, partial [Closterium sp. Naga37s-1]